MKVRSLIKLLQSFDPDLEIVVLDSQLHISKISEVTAAEVFDGLEDMLKISLAPSNRPELTQNLGKRK